MTNNSIYSLTKKLEKSLQVTFRDKSLLSLALTHSSSSEGACVIEHNQRLEFLGDAALELAVSSILYEEFPDLNEGELTRLRSWLVNNNALFEYARNLDLPEHVQTGKSLNPDNKSVNADCLEAIIGAIFLDQSFATVRLFIKRIIKQKLKEACLSTSLPEDPKSKLQKTCLRLWNELPQYSTLNYLENLESGFLVKVNLPDGREANGQGKSKKAAEQDAAQNMLQQLVEA